MVTHLSLFEVQLGEADGFLGYGGASLKRSVILLVYYNSGRRGEQRFRTPGHRNRRDGSCILGTVGHHRRPESRLPFFPDVTSQSFPVPFPASHGERFLTTNVLY